MNRKGSFGDLVTDNLIYILLLVVFFVGMFYYVASQVNGTAIWQQYYAKKIAIVIDFSKPGDEYWIDVHNAVVIAKKNKVASFSEIFVIDNANNEVCVKMSKGQGACYSFFNDVDVVNFELIYGLGEREVNRLHFKTVERSVDVENV